MVQPRLVEKVHHTGNKRHVGTAEDAEAEPGGVLVGDGAHHGFRRLPQASVDDLHAGVAQGAGHHLDAAVVAVQPDLGKHNANWNRFRRHEGSISVERKQAFPESYSKGAGD